MRRVQLALATLIGLALAVEAAADIGIREISRRSAEPGDVVRVTVRGFLGERPWPAMPVVMVAAERAPRPAHGARPRMRRGRIERPPYRLLGVVQRWRPLSNGHAVGFLEFRVPDVSRGRYVFGLFCESCVRGPEGSLIIDPLLVLRRVK